MRHSDLLYHSPAQERRYTALECNEEELDLEQPNMRFERGQLLIQACGITQHLPDLRFLLTTFLRSPRRVGTIEGLPSISDGPAERCPLKPFGLQFFARRG